MGLAPRIGQPPRRTGQHQAVRLSQQPGGLVQQDDRLTHLMFALEQGCPGFPRDIQRQLGEMRFGLRSGAPEHRRPLPRTGSRPLTLSAGGFATGAIDIGRIGVASKAQWLPRSGLDHRLPAAQRGYPIAIEDTLGPQPIIEKYRGTGN